LSPFGGCGSELPGWLPSDKTVCNSHFQPLFYSKLLVLSPTRVGTTIHCNY
jgi:hypothetical protein